MKRIPSDALRSQLAQGQGAGPHPDADLLTAYAEHALLDGERAEVVAHLAACPACRTVVQTAADAAEPEAASVSQPSPGRRPLRSWIPGLAMAASLLAIAGTSVLVYHVTHTNVPGRSTAVAAAPPAAAVPPPVSEPKEKTAPKPATASPAPAPRPVRTRTRQPQAPIPELKPEPNPLENPAEAGGSPSEGLIGGIDFGAAAREAPLRQEEAEKRTQVHAEMHRDMYHGTAVTAQQARKASAPPAAAFNSPFPAESQSRVTALNGFIAQSAAQRRFRIDDSGHIERSAGAGAWLPVSTPPAVRFRVLSSSGLEVWAGGDHLRLFHSTDDGATWSEVQLPPSGGREQAIAHIRIEAPGRVTVEAEDGTVWTTTNDGLTWQ